MTTIDTNDLTLVTGGADFGKGQSFKGRLPGADDYVGADDADRAHDILQNLGRAGFAVMLGTRANGQGPTRDFTATCTRDFCQWNG